LVDDCARKHSTKLGPLWPSERAGQRLRVPPSDNERLDKKAIQRKGILDKEREPWLFIVAKEDVLRYSKGKGFGFFSFFLRNSKKLLLYRGIGAGLQHGHQVWQSRKRLGFEPHWLVVF
jgi:hypothetical protein